MPINSFLVTYILLFRLCLLPTATFDTITKKKNTKYVSAFIDALNELERILTNEIDKYFPKEDDERITIVHRLKGDPDKLNATCGVSEATKSFANAATKISAAFSKVYTVSGMLYAPENTNLLNTTRNFMENIAISLWEVVDIVSDPIQVVWNTINFEKNETRNIVDSDSANNDFDARNT